MAPDSGDKENRPPAAAPVTAARRHGVAVKRCRLKRFGVARRRVPLRDITSLFAVDPVVVEWATLQQPPPAVPHAAKAEPPPAAAQKGLPGVAAVKAGRYSLRKEFR